jgi:hypothetical protein
MAAGPSERFRVEASGKCIRCNRQVSGWIAFGDQDPQKPDQGPSIIIDSGGFMAFASGLVCDPCLGVSDTRVEDAS